MKTDNLTKIAGLSLAALLALTACGDGDNGGNGDADEANSGDEQVEGNGNGEAGGETFAFEDTAAGPYDEITVTVPDEYDDAIAIDIAGSEDRAPEDGGQEAAEYTYAEAEVIESITLRPAEPEEAQCAIEAEYQFNHDNIGDEPVNEYVVDTSGQELPEGEEPGAIFHIEETGTDVLYAEFLGEGVATSGDDVRIDETFAETHTATWDIDCNSPIELAFTAAVQTEYTADDLVDDGSSHDEQMQEDLAGEAWTSFHDAPTFGNEFSANEFATFDVAVDAETGELSIQNAQVDADE